MLFLSDQSSCFLTALSSFSLDIFHFYFKVPSGILAGMSFSDSCRSSLTVDFDWIGCKLPDWYFAFSHSPPHLVVNLIITWSVLQLATLIALVFIKSGGSHCRFMMYSMKCQCLDLGWIQEFLWICSCLKWVLEMSSWCSVRMDSSRLSLVLAFLVPALPRTFDYSSVKVSKKDDFVYIQVSSRAGRGNCLFFLGCWS